MPQQGDSVRGKNRPAFASPNQDAESAKPAAFYTGDAFSCLFASISFFFFQVKAMEQTMNDRSQNNTGRQEQ